MRSSTMGAESMLHGGTMAARLLMYGYDPILLSTRCSILTLAGLGECTLVGKSVSSEGPSRIDDAYSAVVICHTVPEEERNAIAALAARNGKPVLQIERFMRPLDLVTAVSRMVSGGPAA